MSNIQDDSDPYEPKQPRINDKCPACGWKTLFIGAGGWLTCSNVDCPEPATSDAIAALVARREALARHDENNRASAYYYGLIADMEKQEWAMCYHKKREKELYMAALTTEAKNTAPDKGGTE